MGVYESLTREELVRKLLAQENLCHELQGKVGKLKEEISQQAKNGESMRANEGDLCENVTVKRTERFLTDNVARLSLMLEAGNVFPWYADIASGKIEIGDELFKAYGVDRKEFQDDFFSIATFVASIYPDDRGIFEAIYNNLLAGESCKIGLELRLDLLNTGEYKWVDLKGVAQEFDERGKVTKVLGFIADIQKRRDDEQALIEAKQRAEESDRLKSAFLANVSHEIRTPLNAIVGFSEVIAHTEGECEREEYLDIVKANSNLLLHLINDILDLSRIESGRMEFIDENIQMDELCEELRQMHQMRIKNDVKVIFERPAVSLTIVSDSHRLRQLYSNLISNAIKYTEKGSITLGYKLKGNMMEGYVRDTGSGIPVEKLNNVFGVGSCFYFSIPYNGTFPVVGEQNKPLILVAEDMDCNYELVKAILEERYSVLRANDGIDVVTKYESSKPDLILMDVRMPGLDGLSAAGIIRELNPTIPIIATTAFAFETDRGMALAAGCNEYISKPLEAEKLKTMIERCLENKL